MINESAAFIWWDDEKGQIIPRALTDEWHKNYLSSESGRHPRSRVKASARQRYTKIGPASDANWKKLEGVTTLIDAKMIIAEKPSKAQPEIEAQPEKPKAITRSQINRMKMADLAQLADKHGVEIREGASSNDLKVSLIKALQL
jgi:hypothetical protein